MASVIACVLGGTPKRVHHVETVSDVRVDMDLEDHYVATVNGDTAEDDFALEDEDFISFAAGVKAGTEA